MSHPTATPDAVVEAYVATWNETDPARRRAGLAAAWTETGIYRDPVMVSDGPAGIDAMLAGVQAKFPGFVLKRTSKVDAHGGSPGGPVGGPSGGAGARYLRFTWSLGPVDGPSVVEGVDFCTLAPDGRLASVVGFIDKMPVGGSWGDRKGPSASLRSARDDNGGVAIEVRQPGPSMARVIC